MYRGRVAVAVGDGAFIRKSGEHCSIECGRLSISTRTRRRFQLDGAFQTGVSRVRQDCYDSPAVGSHVRYLYAHRGAPAELPENTLPSFRRALDIGATALEMDVHMTRDGVIVVSHDPTGERMAGIPTAIRTSTFDEVRRWDVGRGYVNRDGARPFVGGGFRIPSFEQVLVEFPGVRFNVDAKQPSPSMVRPLIDLIRRHRATDRVLLASFQDATLRAIRAAGYEGPTGTGQLEAARLILSPMSVLRLWPVRGNAAQLPLTVAGRELLTPAMIARCHALGMRADFWTINDADLARRVIAAGADGVMTDDPAAVVSACRDTGFIARA